MRVTRTIDATVDELEDAKKSAFLLVGNTSATKALDLFRSQNLSELEQEIKNLNTFSAKAWLLSSMLLYTLVCNAELYRQSGLDWFHYSRQTRERLGLDNREITEQLGAARFFIKNHKKLVQKGFQPNGNNKKLARAELAQKLCGSVDETISHIVSDTWEEFKAWYTSFKPVKKIEQTASSRPDIKVEGEKFIIGDEEAVTVSDNLSQSDKKRLNDYIKAIFKIMAAGYEPTIVAAYKKKEAALMPKLRDKSRSGK